MNSVTVKNRLPQLRMIPIPGVPLFRYERRVSNRWVACNHSRAAGVVGVYYRRAKRLCASLTDGSETEGVYPSTLSAGSQRPGELSIFAKTMNTANALARSKSFGAISLR